MNSRYLRYAQRTHSFIEYVAIYTVLVPGLGEDWVHLCHRTDTKKVNVINPWQYKHACTHDDHESTRYRNPISLSKLIKYEIFAAINLPSSKRWMMLFVRCNIYIINIIYMSYMIYGMWDFGCRGTMMMCVEATACASFFLHNPRTINK